MRTLLLTTVLTLLCSLTASAEVTASFDFAVSDNAGYLDGMSTTYIFNVELSDTKKLNIEMLTIKSLPREHFPQPVGDAENFTKNLGNFTYSQLASIVTRMQEVELLKENRGVVCMVIPSPGMGNNHIRILKTTPFKRMELIRSPQGCWVSSVVRPKHQYDEVQALQLQSLIKALSMDAAGI